MSKGQHNVKREIINLLRDTWDTLKFLYVENAVDVFALSKLNTDKFTIDDVMKSCIMSRRMSEFCCETAVRQGVFAKFTEDHTIYYCLIDSDR